MGDVNIKFKQIDKSLIYVIDNNFCYLLNRHKCLCYNGLQLLKGGFWKSG